MSDKLPIAEIFTSVQGEGLYAGTLMTFVRLAGCSVGKPIKDSGVPGFTHRPDFKITESYGTIPVWQEECTTYDGRKFCCDTDFRVKDRLSVQEISDFAQAAGVRHVCLTGGEPFIHKLAPLCRELITHELSIHIETSGTIPFSNVFEALDNYHSNNLWITVSPKLGVLKTMILRANEIKLLVDESFNVANLPEGVKDHPLVWVQPINDTNDINRTNIDKCLALLLLHPNWRLSLQLHKILKVR